MPRSIPRAGAAAPKANGAPAAGDTRAGAKLSKATRSQVATIKDHLKAAMKEADALLDDGGERSADARSCGCGNGSSHTPAQTVTQASGAQTATTLDADLRAELARLAEMFPDVEFAVDGGANGGERGLVGIDDYQEAASEGEVMNVYRPAADLPADLKQLISDEVAAQIAAGPTDDPVSISMSAWLQDPDYPFEPGTKAYFAFDLSPEMAERIKAAALGIDQPAATEEPPAEDVPVEDVPAEDVPADGTASATAPETLTIDAATLAMFQSAAA